MGFGIESCNYWLGNELLHQLTKDGQYRLRFDLQSLDSGQWYWADYDTFIVDSEATNYTLTVGGYSGDAEDSMYNHDGRMFTTFDRDNDPYTSGNCADVDVVGGGFWHNNCGMAEVNAARGAGWFGGPAWYKLPGPNRLQTSRMWLKCL